MKKLHDSLLELKRELETIPEDDAAANAKLLELREKIDAVLNDAGSQVSSNHRELNRSLKEALLVLEVKHPKVTAYINAISNILADMGI
jgi:ElaB/YqjD/DUF883 family membrane-anchored ribosome-binding protein